MSRSQRLTFLGIAVAIAAVAVVVLVVAGGGSKDERATAPAPSPGATSTAAATASPTATPTPLLVEGKEQQIDATEGDRVTFRVTAHHDEVVHVHGYNIEKPVPAGTTITISLKATITGIFEIEFHHSGAVVGRLKVVPR
jgi:FtsP/CotA-like multicopper oxidase with cupredoxin domain